MYDTLLPLQIGEASRDPAFGSWNINKFREWQSGGSWKTRHGRKLLTIFLGSCLGTDTIGNAVQSMSPSFPYWIGSREHRRLLEPKSYYLPFVPNDLSYLMPRSNPTSNDLIELSINAPPVACWRKTRTSKAGKIIIQLAFLSPSIMNLFSNMSFFFGLYLSSTRYGANVEVMAEGIKSPLLPLGDSKCSEDITPERHYSCQDHGWDEMVRGGPPSFEFFHDISHFLLKFWF